MTSVDRLTSSQYVPSADLIRALLEHVQRFSALDPHRGRLIYNLLEALEIRRGQAVTSSFQEAFHELERALISGQPDLVAKTRSQVLKELRSIDNLL